MFMHAQHTPLEGQMKIHGYAIGGAPPSPSLIRPPPAADPKNPPPIGSTPANVADNIDAKISEGEFVWPADVVKYYGMDWMQKQITKAKEGMLAMAKAGLIKGNGPPVANTPEPDGDEAGPAPEKPIGAAAGGFFAGPGHPEHYSNGGYQTFVNGGLALPTFHPSSPSLVPSHVVPIPQAHSSPISGRIPHNTGIVRTGVQGPVRSGTSVTALADGGFMSSQDAGCYSAGGTPGGMMTPYAAPAAPMTAQPDPYAAYQQRPQTGIMQPQ
jgi:hypothetical protein